MICGITQPSYLPWRGFFDLLSRCDVFVWFDDVQYTRRSWRNRNRIKSPDSVRWLSVPVHAQGHQEGLAIREVHIDEATDWRRSHRESLHQAYRKAPHYGEVAPLLDDLYAERFELLADFTIHTTTLLARRLGIGGIRLVRSSELNVSADGTERVVAIMQAVGAKRLVNGPTARAYTDHDLLERNGIEVDYMRYDYPEYPQLHEPFEPSVSVVDLLCMTGDDAPRYIWREKE